MRIYRYSFRFSFLVVCRRLFFVTNYGMSIELQLRRTLVRFVILLCLSS